MLREAEEESEARSVQSLRPASCRSTLGESRANPRLNSEQLIFFIHGVGGSSGVWRHQMRHFSRLGYEVAAMDLLGHGGSSQGSRAADFAFAALAQDVSKVFERFAKPALANVVVGHSYGTCFAALLARQRPERVSHLVLLCPGAPEPLDPSLPFPPVLLHLLAPLIRRNFKRKAYAEGKGEAGLDVPAKVLKWTLLGQDWEEGGADFHRRIPANVLLVQGSGDGLVGLEETQAMRRAIPHSQLELLDAAGHMPMLEVPDALNGRLEAFLALGPRSPAASPPQSSRRGSQRLSLAPAAQPTSRQLPPTAHLLRLPSSAQGQTATLPS